MAAIISAIYQKLSGVVLSKDQTLFLFATVVQIFSVGFLFLYLSQTKDIPVIFRLPHSIKEKIRLTLFCIFGMILCIPVVGLFSYLNLSLGKYLRANSHFMQFVNTQVNGMTPFSFLEPKNEKQPIVQALLNTDSTIAILVMSFLAIVLAPLLEEIVFRGFMYQCLRKYIGRVFAAIITAFLFAMVHPNPVMTLFPLMFLGLMFVVAYEKSGTLVAPMVMHGTFNATSIILMLLLPPNYADKL